MGVGLVPAWDNTNGKAVISDVIQAWAEQLSTNVPARAGTIESYVRSKDVRKRFPLPEALRALPSSSVRRPHASWGRGRPRRLESGMGCHTKCDTAPNVVLSAVLLGSCCGSYRTGLRRRKSALKILVAYGYGACISTAILSLLVDFLHAGSVNLLPPCWEGGVCCAGQTMARDQKGKGQGVVSNSAILAL